MSDPPVDLDAASSEPLHPAAREALLSALERGYADPARLHRRGREARLLLDNAREVVASLLGVRPDEVSFTSSGTTAVHLGVLGLLLGRRRVSPRLVHAAVEHSAVMSAGTWWQQHFGGTSTSVAVDEHGRVRLDELADALREPAGVVAVQVANPEVGTLQPFAEAASLAAEREVPVFADAAAAVGHVPLPGLWAVAAASAHKWGGPAGVGILLVRKGARWRAPFPTDDRLDPRLAGYENVPGALAAAAALQAVSAEQEEVAARQRALVDLVRREAAKIPDVEVVGHPTQRLPHVVTFSCLSVDGESLVTELDRRGFAVSSGSACTASSLEPSHVLAAMGALTHGNVRVSLGRDTTAADVDRLLELLPDLVGGLSADHASGEAPSSDDGVTELDCRAMSCPMPVIRLGKAVDELAVGGKVAVVADDPAARPDITAWCRMRGHELVGEDTADDGIPRFLVRRSH